MWLQEMEMSAYEAILARRSVRRYSSREVDRNTIGTLLKAAVCAPTSMQAEPWAFVIIQNKALLRQISDRAKPLLAAESRGFDLGRTHRKVESVKQKNFNLFYDAGTLIVIGASTEDSFVAAADCWLAAENLMLAACAMGLGTCVIGSVRSVLNSAVEKAELGVPDSYFAIAPIVVGYPRGETGPVPRRAPVVLAHFPAEEP
jgi:nitroreductase